MTAQTALDIIKTYGGELNDDLDHNTIKEVEIEIPFAGKMGIKSYQLFQLKFKTNPDIFIIFKFVYLEQPDQYIAHKLLNMNVEVIWHYLSEKNQQPPVVVSTVLYNGQKEWKPKSIKDLYPIDFVDFNFLFIDLKRGYSQTI